MIRVTADCPVFDAELLDDAIEKMRPESDYMAAVSETLADGLDLEIMRFDVLKTTWKEARLLSYFLMYAHTMHHKVYLYIQHPLLTFLKINMHN